MCCSEVILHEVRQCILLHEIFVFKKNTDFNKQHMCFKLCFKIGNPDTETYGILKLSLGKETMSSTQIFGHGFQSSKVEKILLKMLNV
jgi:hypothetical protein